MAKQQPDLLEMITADRKDALIKRERNRQLAAIHMPQFLRLMDGLREAGMDPRVVQFEIYEERKAA